MKKYFCSVCNKEIRYGRKYCQDCSPYKGETRNSKLYHYKNRLQLKRKALDINGSNVCISCGESNLYLLEFHHLQDKDFQISDRIYNGGIKKDFADDLVKEIRKCVVICKKCHMKQHPELITKRIEIKREIYTYSGEKCKDCIETDVNVMNWHHRDPLIKSFEIGRGIKDCGNKKRSIQSLKREVDKCDMLCTNCHTLRHKQEYEERIGYGSN